MPEISYSAISALYNAYCELCGNSCVKLSFSREIAEALDLHADVDLLLVNIAAESLLDSSGHFLRSNCAEQSAVCACLSLYLDLLVLKLLCDSLCVCCINVDNVLCVILLTLQYVEVLCVSLLRESLLDKAGDSVAVLYLRDLALLTRALNVL